MKNYPTKFKSFQQKIVQMGALQKLQNSIQTLIILWWNRELTLKCKLKCYEKPMKDPLGISPSKGYQGTTRGKEKILLISVGIEPTTSGLDLPLLCRLSYEVRQRKSWSVYPIHINSLLGDSWRATIFAIFLLQILLSVVKILKFSWLSFEYLSFSNQRKTTILFPSPLTFLQWPVDQTPTSSLQLWHLF